MFYIIIIVYGGSLWLGVIYGRRVWMDYPTDVAYG